MAERNLSSKKKMLAFADGKVLFVSAAFPPSVGGSVVVMRELLRHYDPDSYNIVSLRSIGNSGDPAFEKRVFRIGARKIRPYSLSLWIRFLQVPFVLSASCRYAKKIEARRIVCIYPTIDFLFLGYLMSKRLGLPLVVYLHDTVAEALVKTTFAIPARILQRAVFKRASRILVMSEGMRQLYLDKYGLETTVIPHIYSEKVPHRLDNLLPVARRLFWGGAVYSINNRALNRVISAMQKLQIAFRFTTRNRHTLLDALSLKESEALGIETVYYDSRESYLAALPVNGVMVLALNTPEESDYGADELATIFPTKTPEYLASGAPILVHCPEHYFLARFFREHNCGLVVSDRDSEKIAMAIEKLLKSDAEVNDMRRNAMKMRDYFDAESICRRFSCAVQGSEDVE